MRRRSGMGALPEQPRPSPDRFPRAGDWPLAIEGRAECFAKAVERLENDAPLLSGAAA